MIISASRRTDIPAFYSAWFMRRLEAEYCTVVNPFNHKQISYVSLKPEDVDAIVFWTRNAKPLLPYLTTLNTKKIPYYFQYTITGYPKILESNTPDLNEAITTFQILSEQIGADRVIWRYDPICQTNITDCEWHIKQFTYLAQALRGKTKRVIISIVDNYRKAEQNFRALATQGIVLEKPSLEEIGLLMQTLAKIAQENNIEIFSCAERLDLTPYGIKPGKCIDDVYLKKVFGISVKQNKDKGQRPECGCIQSKDIGAYDTCLHGCTYCYAGTLKAGRTNYKEHDINSPSLIGFHDITIKPLKNEQGKLF
ncbi:MAG TPA: DUF1848 domain-containing protein [Candidatus Avacidaminococcus intestinavium]|uniref:DUF1848 domain-containing protein n=1 Tax=Candidatus Avacidaminococcus intestinavium TaxID=2840684 RepID=A0A9D1MPC5_9FIRM|nr:DUF1848 domain-containing protein [Candidatus Avacidaminococcus intestinavium]